MIKKRSIRYIYVYIYKQWHCCMSLVNELCPRVNARPWIYRPHSLWHSNTRGKNRSYRTVKMFLPLCTQSLGLALVSVISPLSFILRLNNSAHFGKQIQCQDNASTFYRNKSVRRARVECRNQSNENTAGIYIDNI